MNKFYPLLIFIFGFLISPSASGEDYGLRHLAGGLKFNSYEVTKDQRTGLNLTPEDPIFLENYFVMEFEMAFWREKEAYGHIFRLHQRDGINIDLISSPYSSKLDDITLIIGDSATSISFSFAEIKFKVDDWKSCKFELDLNNNAISLSIDGKTKSQIISTNLNNFNIAFGKNDFGLFSISDVPPLKIRNIKIFNNHSIIRSWPLMNYYENDSYDELDANKCRTTNPNWIINNHSKWQRSYSMSVNSRPQIVYDNENIIYLLTDSSLVTYNLSTNRVSSRTSVNRGFVQRPQSSIYKPESHEIWMYNQDISYINKFNIDELQWDQPVEFKVKMEYNMHSNVEVLDNGDALFFGGYGHYNYRNSLHISKGEKWKSFILENIEPRYLSAMGKNNKGDIYLFGGYGSKTGSQEISPRPFYQLHSIDVVNKTSKKLWEMEDTESDDVFSNSLVFDPNDSIFYVLRYPKDKYSCKVTLESYNIFTQERQTFADSLDFKFTDVLSHADLLLDKERNQLIAVLMSKTEEGFITDFYGIKFPPVTLSSIYQTPPKKLSQQYTLWVFLLFASLGLVFFIYKRRDKNKPNKQQVEDTPQIEIEADFDDSKSTISLLGGFQVIDNAGMDISEKFTGTLRMLLSLILLHSVNGKGVSSTFIWETIWDDKPEDKARNNRNVNIKKLRSILSQVGNIEIKNTGDKWGIVIGSDVFFDYSYIQNILKNNAKMPTTALKLVKKGNILPAMEDDWIDDYKAKFSNQLVDNLLKLSKDYKKGNNIQIQIADTIFSHDIINQDALSIKILCLNANHKFALAKQCYMSYAKEYKVLYDEDFDVSFEDIINDKIV